MVITESNRIVLIAIAAGFLSGSCQSILSYVLDESEQQLLSGKQLIAKFLYFSFSHAIIFGVMVFALSVWDTSMSAAKLNRFTIAMAIFFAIAPLHDRFWSFVFSRLKQTRS